MSGLGAILAGRIGAGTAKALGRTARPGALWPFLFDGDKRASDNAAWALTHLPRAANAWLTERQDALIDEAMRTASTTKRRLLLNLLRRTAFERDRIRPDFLDFCFNLMLSDEPVGVRVLAVKLAYAQSAPYPELLAEFDTSLKMIDAAALPASLRCVRGKMLRAVRSLQYDDT